MSKNDAKQKITVRNWSHGDQPREKLLEKGPSALSDVELLAILLRSGTAGQNVVDLAREVLSSVNNNLNELGRKPTDFFITNFNGIGEAKAVTLTAALELGRRRRLSQTLLRPTIRNSKDLYEYFAPLLSDATYEAFHVLALNNANNILESQEISHGGMTGTVVDPRLVFTFALKAGAVAIALCHNHPSGNIAPSEEDKRLTRKLAAAAQTMDIRLIDHIIIGNNRYFSFVDEKLL